MSESLSLVEFLLARIAEDEEEIISSAVWDDARQRRDLAECESKRRIIELHQLEHSRTSVHCGECDEGHQYPSWPCTTLRLLALPYADHPAYRSEWAP